MSLATPFRQGDIILIAFPFTDLSSQKVRPALIVGRVTGDDVIVAFITSRTGRADARAAYLLVSADPEFAQTGLRATSLIRLDKLVTLHTGLVRRRLGRIGPITEEAVGRALRYVFNL